MYAQPDTTSIPRSIYAEGTTASIAISIPFDRDQWWVLRAIDWSVDKKPWPVGVIEVRDETRGQVLWKQYFTDPGFYSREMDPGLLNTVRGTEVRVTVTAGDCKKTLGVLYK